MARISLRAAACTVIISAWTLNSAFAQTSSVGSTAGRPSGDSPTYSVPQIPSRATYTAPANTNSRAVQQASFHDHPAYSHPSHPAHSYPVGVHVQHPHYVTPPTPLPGYAQQITPNGYPFVNAPLYPTPLPYIPYQVGATVLTNQAFYPHEMLYPHTYRAMYPPYYYEVKGGWKVFPTGVGQVESWRLRGTVVKVKYSSSIGLCSGFIPPAN